MPYAGEIAAVVGPGHVAEGTADDAIDGVRPALVVTPGTATEVSEVLKVASQKGLSVAARGGGTARELGNVPSNLDLIVDTSRLERVVEHARGDLVVVVEGGARMDRVQETLAEAGQMLALDGIAESATIGGVIAANSSGPRRYRYGTVRDLLIGVTIVLSDGTVAKAGGKVVKNVAGYDLSKLMTGSLGTLGIIVEAVFRLHPRPPVGRLVQVVLGNVAGLTSTVQDVLHSSIVPSAVECDWSPGGECVLGVLLEGIEPSVEAQAATAAEILGQHGTVGETLDAAEHFPLVRPGSARMDQVVVRVTTVPNRLSDTAALITKAVRNLGSVAVSGSVGNGIMDVRVDTDDPAAVAAMVEEIRAGLHEGHAVVLAAPPEVKRFVDVWGPVGDSLDLMRSVKTRFDPSGTLNPGRFVGGI